MSLIINDFFSKVYYINLEEDDKKREYFLNTIKKSTLSTTTERFNAVIGKYLDIRIIKDNIISPKAKKDILAGQQHTYGISLTYGSLACALSHHQIFEECRHQDRPYLIFEDDIIIDHTFDNKLNDVLINLSKVESYDIVYLGYNEIPGFTKKPFDNILSTPHGLITGLYGYILSPQGAKKLIEYIFPLDKQIDSSISDNRDKFDLYCASNSFVGVKTNFGSKTQQDNSCKNIFNKKINQISPTIDTHQDYWDKLFQ
jgi:GR25 family glycosyltransferase involved in LPS biosynthesis